MEGLKFLAKKHNFVISEDRTFIDMVILHSSTNQSQNNNMATPDAGQAQGRC